ncbi:extracellular solute-binding protein [Segetibacter sp. 3557_3]|uniref:extracellular solute-binding protein n=1 Tax=Segetibacter sp. 3557_3 TaxID=2547429 RepID=UPI0010585C42|nr:extracellular solute-binding protein [Segetibacter sp. 3557_3]TDH27492.1 extracellular solute-binding protein [Segetibacter sp. 3557_3]
MSKIVLKGITWGHSRGITPLLAYSQRFSELNPQVEVSWTKRTLQEFADFPIEKLTEEYDLLIIDHPWVGCAAATGCVLPLEEYLPAEYLDDQLANSVGFSHQSYEYGGHQWALAIDAATPVASYRKDLLEQNGVGVPKTWEEVIRLAEQGRVAVPAIAIDTLMNFYMFCIAHGTVPFASEEEVIDAATGLRALETMRSLYVLLDKKMFERNPIAVAELMSSGDQFWYCPFAYGYSNYSRVGYAENLLHYDDLVSFNEVRLRSTVGGTGLAVSATSNNVALAVKYAAGIVSRKIQSTFYVQHGGQPGHRSAWLNKNANLLCNEYFTRVMPAMENGYIRPRYNGYLHFQDHAGDPLRNFLLNGGTATDVLQEINELYRHSLQPAI